MVNLNIDVGWHRIPSLAGIVGPVLVVLAMRFLSGAGPTEAPAAQIQIEGVSPDLDAQVRAGSALSDRQMQALQWVASLGSVVPERSPMENGSRREQAPSPQVEQPTVAPATPEFTLRAVLGGRERLASINGRIRREGDEIRPGWRLTRVGADLQTVEITGPGGQIVRVSLSR